MKKHINEKLLSDMESDGVYFPDHVKILLEKEREERLCEYSGLPSPKAYDVSEN
jgi:hypothetical protein